MFGQIGGALSCTDTLEWYGRHLQSVFGAVRRLVFAFGGMAECASGVGRVAVFGGFMCVVCWIRLGVSKTL